jgi:hypothetical protein
MPKQVDQRIFNKGRQVPTDGLLQQARAHIALVEKHAGELATYGWSKAATASLKAGTEAVENDVASRAALRETSRAATRKEAAARQAAKGFIRKLRLAVPLIVRRGDMMGVTKGAFNAGEALRISSSKISKYLIKVRSFVEKLDGQLTPYFGGRSPAAELEAVKSALDDAGVAQETLRAQLPGATLKLYMSSGALLDQIEDLNRVAKIAFDDRRDIAAQFNKNLIRRASRFKS